MKNLQRVTLELSSKPFIDDSEATAIRVADHLFTQWLPLIREAQEVAIMADRCAIDEELARLESHLRQMGAYLEAEGEIGKKMDFLIQEMNREANTIGSKCTDVKLARIVVDIKAELEKIREQTQNIE